MEFKSASSEHDDTLKDTAATIEEDPTPSINEQLASFKFVMTVDDADSSSSDGGQDNDALAADEFPSFQRAIRPGTPDEEGDSPQPVSSKETRDSLIERIKELIDTKEQDESEHRILEHLICGEVARMNSHEEQLRESDAVASDETGDSDDNKPGNARQVETQYLSSLRDFEKQWNDFQEETKTKSSQIQTLQAKLSGARAEFEEKRQEIRDKRRRQILKSRYKKTGKPFDARSFTVFEKSEEGQTAQMLQLMRETSFLRSEISKLSEIIRQKETLTDGLHLIDFEQLRIENQSLQEKIEDRNTEVFKLSAKKNSIIHTLVHIQLKNDSARDSCSKLRSSHSVLQDQFNDRRDIVPKLKMKRDKLRKEALLLKKESGFIGNRSLLEDYETKYDLEQALSQEVNQLSSRYHKLVYGVKKAELDARKAAEARLRTQRYGQGNDREFVIKGGVN